MRIEHHWPRALGVVLCCGLYFLMGCAGNATPTVTVAAAITHTPLPTPTSSVTPSPTLSPTRPATVTSTPSLTPTITSPPPSHTPTAAAAATSTPSATATTLPTNTPIPQPTTPPVVSIGSIPDHLGSEISIAGQVAATASFAGGYKFTLSDGTGQVTLLMWSNVYDNCWDAPTLNLGATVQATGTVGQFEGEWQVEPDFGGDVKVTASGSLPPMQTIGSLGDFMGQRVTIIGQINRVEGTSSGVKLFVADESGEVLVFIWNNTLDRIPNNTLLGVPGTRVQVVGYVQEFRSNREIIPALPYDVTVLP